MSPLAEGRQYVDDRGEITGSRRYFTGRFRDEVHLLRRELNWQLSLITILLVEMFSLLIVNLLDLDEEMAKKFSASAILQRKSVGRKRRRRTRRPRRRAAGRKRLEDQDASHQCH